MTETRKTKQELLAHMSVKRAVEIIETVTNISTKESNLPDEIKHALNLVICAAKDSMYEVKEPRERLEDKYVMAALSGAMANEELLNRDDSFDDFVITVGREIYKKVQDRKRGIDQIPPVTKSLLDMPEL